MRVGIGHDTHRLEAGRPLILGGVRINHPRGLIGHSDADVVLHAVADALLGAAGLGDIGEHFPDTDPEWKDLDSAKLLIGVVREVAMSDERAAYGKCLQSDVPETEVAGLMDEIHLFQRVEQAVRRRARQADPVRDVGERQPALDL